MKRLLANILAAGAIMGTSMVAHADSAGWQSKGVDKYTIEGDTIRTSIKSLDGGGVKVCFSGLAYDYTVKMFEADKTSPDDPVAGTKILTKSSECITWSKVNEDDGKEELYLELNKNNTKSDTIMIEWFD